VELGDGAVVETSTSFLQLRLDVREPAHVAGFGISGFWVGRLLRESPQAVRRRQPVTRHRVAESGEIRLAQQQGRPWVPRVQRMRTKAVDPQPESGRFAESAPEMLRVQCRFGARVGFGGSRCAVLSRLCS
jgi:hypothetical protein